MHQLLVRLAVLSIAVMLTAGCGSSGSGSSLFGSSSGSSGSSGGVSGSSSGDSGSGSDSGGTPLARHNPEPATLALVASGLAAYVLLKRNQKK